MILKSLYEYGKRNPPPSLAFRQDKAHYVLDIDSQRGILALTFMGEPVVPPEGKRSRKKKTESKLLFNYPEQRIPAMTEDWGKSRSAQVAPQYLFDNFQYLFGFTNEKLKVERASKCAEEFRRKLEEILERTGSKAVGAILEALKKAQKDPQQIAKLISVEEGKPVYHASGFTFPAPKQWEKSHSILIRVDDKFIFDYPEIESDWNDQYSSSGNKKRIQCLVTGRPSVPVRLHRKIKMRGTQASGAGLISFNEDAFESFGMKGNENAPMSAEASEIISVALERLVISPRNHYDLPSGATAIFFSGDDEVDHLFAKLMDSNPVAVKAIFEAPYKGLPDSSTLNFTSFILRGESGRISPRCFVVKRHTEVLDSLKQHFNDLDIGSEYPLKMLSILGSAFPNKKHCSFGATEECLYLSCIEGTPYPRNILQGLLERCMHIPQGSNRKEKQFIYDRLLRTTASYGKAYINRSIRAGRIPNTKPLEVHLDKTNVSIAYRLGRLLAALERLKWRAIPTSPPLSESAMSMFQQRPSLAVSIHYGNAKHHLAKLKRLGVWLDVLMDEIMSTFELDQLPQRLSVEDRAIFILGYVQQKAEFFKKREDLGTGKGEEVTAEE